MKLRNKKTGEIIDLNKGSITDVGLGSKIQLQATDRYNKPIWVYDSLAELNAELEDVLEEPKEWWYIDIHGPHKVTNNDEYYQQVKAASKEIGNYFESPEEAELALRKLKAWKRLKDKGFRFCGKTYETDKRFGSIFYEVDENTYSEDIIDALDLLFGGEE